MRIPSFILIFVFFVSCKTSRTHSENLNKTEFSEYYDGGEIKSLGSIDDFHKEFYKNGNLKEYLIDIEKVDKSYLLSG